MLREAMNTYVECSGTCGVNCSVTSIPNGVEAVLMTVSLGEIEVLGHPNSYLLHACPQPLVRVSNPKSHAYYFYLTVIPVTTPLRVPTSFGSAHKSHTTRTMMLKRGRAASYQVLTNDQKICPQQHGLAIRVPVDHFEQGHIGTPITNRYISVEKFSSATIDVRVVDVKGEISWEGFLEGPIH
ncbi:hypothetical protein BC826DRAFT_543631 [Russula brevipes]|nr:hypothetical protein BC826DRAFT_543631 [Russula brevipes]